MDYNKLSPMMKHYLSIKEKHPNCIILYRLGDFYEMFFDDAITASKVLDITLTGRDCGLEERAPMCGVPYHAVDGYVAKLIDAGYKVGICEQLTKPTKGVMVERDVIRIITPGTIIEDNMLTRDTNNYLCSVYESNGMAGISWVDVSTGEMLTCCLDTSDIEQRILVLEEYLLGISPSEIICNNETQKLLSEIASVKSERLPRPYSLENWLYTYNNCYSLLQKQFKVNNLISFEIEERKACIISSGALIHYLNETQKRNLTQISTLKYKNNSDFLQIDSHSKRNLEIFETLRDRKRKGSLLCVLDKTQSAIGARQLRRWLEEPLCNEKQINDRLDAVEQLILNEQVTFEITQSLSGFCDLERLSSQVAYQNISPRNLLQLGISLTLLPALKDRLNSYSCRLLKRINNQINPLKDISKLITSAISENTAVNLKDGGVIKEGYSSQLDELRDITENGALWVSSLEQTEREQTGIKSLKIKFNKVFGYYIEVTKSFLSEVPLRYIRKQTISTGERFTTVELKELEEKILSANEKAILLEEELYTDLISKVNASITEILSTAKSIAALDALQSFAAVSVKYGYTKPTINSKLKQIKIEEGKHPVILSMLGNDFVSNDTLLDDDENRTMIITGPNMAGKSTYMRQIALITLMAHIGCFVPARSAEISICDRIFTRVGASDDLSYALSTFMVEMLEVANILNYATKNSLILLDEIGRGTSTYDGLSIAWSVLEYINDKIRAKTLFATHYHELTELEGILKGVKNYRVLVNEIGGTVVFLHRIARGGANKSFGIEVAGLAGVPKEITSRAKEIAKLLEQTSLYRDTNMLMMDMTSKNNKQMQFFDDDAEIGKQIVAILRDTNIDECSPLQCFAILKDLIEKARKN